MKKIKKLNKKPDIDNKGKLCGEIINIFNNLYEFDLLKFDKEEEYLSYASTMIKFIKDTDMQLINLK